MYYIQHNMYVMWKFLTFTAVWKNEFSLTKNLFREINALVPSLSSSKATAFMKIAKK